MFYTKKSLQCENAVQFCSRYCSIHTKLLAPPVATCTPFAFCCFQWGSLQQPPSAFVTT